MRSASTRRSAPRCTTTACHAVRAGRRWTPRRLTCPYSPDLNPSSRC
jgi:hypothetical protein